MPQCERLKAPCAALADQVRYDAIVGALDAAGEGLAIIDLASRRIVYANRALGDMFGYGVEELYALDSFWRLMPADEIAGHFEKYSRMLEGSRPVPAREPFEVNGVRKDGLRIVIQGSYQMTDVDGRPHFVIIVRDVTERVRSERALRESEGRVRMIVDSLPIVLFSIDRNGVVTMAKGSGFGSFGLRPEDQAGRSAMAVIEELDMPEATDLYMRALGGEHASGTFDVRGRVYDVHYAPLRNAAGDVTGVSGMAFDVTARAAAEQAVLRSIDEKKRMIVDLAHGLQTPMTVLKGEIDVLRGKVRDSRRFEAVDRAVERLSRLVYDFLRLARLDAGLHEEVPVPIDLSGLLQETVEYVQILAEEKGIAVRGDIARDVIVCGVRADLEELLNNLVSNALKYMPEGRGGTVSITLRKEGKEAILQVQDDGVGISPEVLPRIFDRFYRVRSSDGVQGSGLGLAICKRIAERHGGAIAVESALGRGSTFAVVLPTL